MFTLPAEAVTLAVLKVPARPIFPVVEAREVDAVTLDVEAKVIPVAADIEGTVRVPESETEPADEVTEVTIEIEVPEAIVILPTEETEVVPFKLKPLAILIVPEVETVLILEIVPAVRVIFPVEFTT
jgi:hypothetical protein